MFKLTTRHAVKKHPKKNKKQKQQQHKRTVATKTTSSHDINTVTTSDQHNCTNGQLFDKKIKKPSHSTTTTTLFKKTKLPFSTLFYGGNSSGNGMKAQFDEMSESEIDNLIDYANYNEKEFESDIGSDYENQLYDEDNYNLWLRNKFSPIFLSSFNQLLYSSGVAQFPPQLTKSQLNRDSNCYPSSHLNRELCLKILVDHNIIIPAGSHKHQLMSSAIPEDIKRIKQSKINEIWQKLENFQILDEISSTHYKPGFSDPFLDYVPGNFTTPLPDPGYIDNFKAMYPNWPEVSVPMPKNVTIVDVIYNAMVLAGGKDYINGHYRIQSEEIWPYQLDISDFSHLLPKPVHNQDFLTKFSTKSSNNNTVNTNHTNGMIVRPDEFNLTKHKERLNQLAPDMVRKVREKNKEVIEEHILAIERVESIMSNPNNNNNNNNNNQQNDQSFIHNMTPSQEFDHLMDLFNDYHRYDIRLGWSKESKVQEALLDKVLHHKIKKSPPKATFATSTQKEHFGLDESNNTNLSTQIVSNNNIDEDNMCPLSTEELSMFRSLVKRSLVQYLFDFTFLYQPQVHHSVFNMDLVQENVRNYYQRQFASSSSMDLPSSKEVIDVNDILASPSLQTLSKTIMTSHTPDDNRNNKLVMDNINQNVVHTKNNKDDDIMKLTKSYPLFKNYLVSLPTSSPQLSNYTTSTQSSNRLLWKDLRRKSRYHLILTPPKAIIPIKSLNHDDFIIDNDSTQTNNAKSTNSTGDDKNIKKQANVMKSGSGDAKSLRKSLKLSLKEHTLGSFIYPALKQDELSLVNDFNNDNLVDSSSQSGENDEELSSQSSQQQQQQPKPTEQTTTTSTSTSTTQHSIQIHQQPSFLSPTGNPPREPLRQQAKLGGVSPLEDMKVQWFDPFQHPLLEAIPQAKLQQAKIITPKVISHGLVPAVKLGSRDLIIVDGNSIEGLKKSLKSGQFDDTISKRIQNELINIDYQPFTFDDESNNEIKTEVHGIIKTLFSHHNPSKKPVFTINTYDNNNNNDQIITTMRKTLNHYYSPQLSYYFQLHAPNLFQSLVNDAGFDGYSLPQREWDILASIVGLSITQYIIDRNWSIKGDDINNNNNNNNNTIPYKHVLLTNDDQMMKNIEFLTKEFEPYLPAPLVCAFRD